MTRVGSLSFSFSFLSFFSFLEAVELAAEARRDSAGVEAAEVRRDPSMSEKIFLEAARSKM